jgi:hypothetical protein
VSTNDTVSNTSLPLRARTARTTTRAAAAAATAEATATRATGRSSHLLLDLLVRLAPRNVLSTLRLPHTLATDPVGLCRTRMETHPLRLSRNLLRTLELTLTLVVGLHTLAPLGTQNVTRVSTGRTVLRPLQRLTVRTDDAIVINIILIEHGDVTPAYASRICFGELVHQF